MGKKRPKPLTAEEKAFYDGFVDTTSAIDIGRSRQSYLKSAIRDLELALGQHSRLERKLGEPFPSTRAIIERALFWARKAAL